MLIEKIAKRPIIIPIATVVLLVFIFSVLLLKHRNIKTVTIKQVNSVLQAQGLEPEDATKRREAENAAVVSATEVKNGEFYFTYISFIDDSNAFNANGDFRSYVTFNRYGRPYIETGDSYPSYNIYTLTVEHKDKYSVCVRVKNTVIYAQSNLKDASTINKIMKEIGYFRK